MILKSEKYASPNAFVDALRPHHGKKAIASFRNPDFTRLDGTMYVYRNRVEFLGGKSIGHSHIANVSSIEIVD